MRSWVALLFKLVLYVGVWWAIVVTALEHSGWCARRATPLPVLCDRTSSSRGGDDDDALEAEAVLTITECALPLYLYMMRILSNALITACVKTPSSVQRDLSKESRLVTRKLRRMLMPRGAAATVAAPGGAAAARGGGAGGGEEEEALGRHSARSSMMDFFADQASERAARAAVVNEGRNEQERVSEGRNEH